MDYIISTALPEIDVNSTSDVSLVLEFRAGGLSRILNTGSAIIFQLYFFLLMVIDFVPLNYFLYFLPSIIQIIPIIYHYSLLFLMFNIFLKNAYSSLEKERRSNSDSLLKKIIGRQW